MFKITGKNLTKFISLIFIISIFYIGFGASDSHAANPVIKIKVDGKPVYTDVAPIVQNQRTLVPARALFEATKATVDWDGKTGVTIKSPDSVINLTLGNTAAYVNGVKKTMDVPASILNNRTFIPLRFVSEELKYNVVWDQNTYTVLISSGSVPAPEPPKPPVKPTETNPNRTLAVPYNPQADGKLVVMLDPGHGKNTPGKRAFDGSFFEYEFNRDISKRITKYLTQRGILVKETVTEDLIDTPLSKRVEISNKSDADIFVSIHANAFGSSWNKANGWEIYCYKKNSHGGKLAKAIHDANIPEVGLKDRGVKETNNPGLYVIRKATKPAVLIEHGFFSNKEELAKLKDSSFREKMAMLDAKGICNFFGINW